MGAQTLIEKILSTHAGRAVRAGDVIELAVDSRVARDFGGANVVDHLRRSGLPLDDAGKTFFTFDCNPAGSDQRYASNQHACRQFARQQGAGLYDVGAGIGTHLAIDEGLVWPGSTLVSTDSHANIVGAVGAFGQGMGDVDIAAAMAHGTVWFKVPPSALLRLHGRPSPEASAKDIVLKILEQTGASGLLGFAAELRGELVAELSLDARITLASMATEMGAIALLIEPNDEVMAHCHKAAGDHGAPPRPNADAHYDKIIDVDLQGLGPMIARPGKPHDVTTLDAVRGTPIDSAFVGSCTNGRIEDLRVAAALLKDRRVAPGVVLKIVPSTDAIWRQALDEGLISAFKKAGALVSSAGCAGCAEGQVGQNGADEVSVSSGNRNYPGKQGRGQVWLASPATVVASALLGSLQSASALQRAVEVVDRSRQPAGAPGTVPPGPRATAPRDTFVEGRVYVIDVDDVDTDMIFHNRHLAITDRAEMAQHAFGNLPGHTGFPSWVQPGDIVWAGRNFGCGSSRQQAVDALLALGVSAIIAQSFAAIYWRNAINAGLAALRCERSAAELGVVTGDGIRLDLASGELELLKQGTRTTLEPLDEVPLAIVRRGGLLGG